MKEEIDKNQVIIFSHLYKKENRNNKKILHQKKIFTIISKIIITFLLLSIFIFQKYKNNISFFLLNKKKEITESKYYESFEKMKLRYINNTLFKPYIENIKIISHIYNKNYQKLKKNKNNINICVSINNNYVYIQLVSIESVLINSDKSNTFTTYHILCSPDVTEKTLSILKSLVNKYPFNLEMIFYNMRNTFMKLRLNIIRIPQMYRLVTPLIVDADRIMHLDGDTLTLKDLSKMNNISFNDNYILGYLDYMSRGIDYLGKYSRKYINSGVILINLKKIRQDNKIAYLFNFINKHRSLPNFDQAVINYVFYPKIGILKSEFVIFNFYDILDIRKYIYFLRTKVNINEILKSLKSPTIIHSVLCWPKIWSIRTKYSPIFSACRQRKNCSCKKYHDLWYFYASKTDYYQKIKSYTGKK